MSSFNITIFSKWKRNFLALTRKRHSGFQAVGRDIQVFGQWQKTSRFSGNGRRHPGFHAVARDNLRRFGRSLSSMERLPCLGGWTLCQLVIITNHQSQITNQSPSPIHNPQSPAGLPPGQAWQEPDALAEQSQRFCYLIKTMI